MTHTHMRTYFDTTHWCTCMYIYMCVDMYPIRRVLWGSQVLSTWLLSTHKLLLYLTWVDEPVHTPLLYLTRVEHVLYLASRVQGASPHFGPQTSAFLPWLAQHDPICTHFYLQLVYRSYLALVMAFYWLLLALLGSNLASWQVGCTESSYFYSTWVVGSITWTLLE